MALCFLTIKERKKHVNLYKFYDHKGESTTFLQIKWRFPGITFGKAVSWDIIQVALTSIMPSVFSNLYIAKEDMGPRLLFMDLVYLPFPQPHDYFLFYPYFLFTFISNLLIIILVTVAIIILFKLLCYIYIL